MSYVILRVFNLKDLETLKKNTKICYLKIPSQQPFFSALLLQKKNTHTKIGLLLYFLSCSLKKVFLKKTILLWLKGFENLENGSKTYVEKTIPIIP